MSAFDDEIPAALDDLLVRMSVWADEWIGEKPTRTWMRVAKVAEEAGEAIRALEKADGGHRVADATMDDVAEELLDVAGAALTAWCHLHGNEPGAVLPALLSNLERVVRRVGA